ncbi:ABC transporter permease subunit [Blastococcus xanthinilyticus]|uniref:ABC-type transport system involved in multi-copper enzyme maturation permease subunit n=1 Tax=Blastococcus xanthinilyticus TaxID=1564164 RepID=A0A5S5D3B7_9ACTN|nr:ABC transporter permease subunit [Blastococcus xanthinilyticus]TYP90523.1 ABC-type transport system involved in multi-copper enzyme maturation permease subunit [Blastococcus xanthinilyticus]
MTTTLIPPDLTTAITPDHPAEQAAAREQRRSGDQPARFAGVVRSEWVKLRSVRSSKTTLFSAAGVLLFVGLAAAAFTGGLLAQPADAGDGPGAGDPTSIVMSGLMLAPLIIAVLGVMAITAEYATGTIRTTMMMVPARLPVLWAKVVVLSAVAVPVMVVTSMVTFVAGQALLDAGGTATTSLGDPGVLRAVLGSGLYLAGIAVIGLAFGALLRGTATAISALFAVLFLVPGLGALLLPSSIQDSVLPYLPSNAASSFTSVTPGPELLSTTTGAVVFAAWVVIPVLAAAVALKRRPI